MQNVGTTEKTQDEILNEAKVTVEKGVILLNWRAPFFGAIISSLNREYTFALRPATMAVTADTLYIHPEFVVNNPDMVLFALCHEALHVAFEHVCRLPQGDKWLRNIAADYVVNGIIAERETLDALQVSIPKSVLYDPQFTGMCLEEVYSILQKQQQARSNNSAGTGQGNGGMDGGVGGGEDPSTPHQGNAGKEQNTGTGTGEGTFDSHDWKSGEESPATIARVRDIVMRAVATAKSMGKLPGTVQRFLDTVEESRTDWKEILAAFFSAASDREDYSSRPSVLTASVSQSIGDWTFVPTLDGVRAGKIGVVIDTSGSISEDQLRVFLGEVLALQYIVSELRVYYADAAVQSTLTYAEFDSPQVDELVRHCVGGGGTDFRPAVHKAIEDDCQAIIYLTDGYGTFPEGEPEIPVLWTLVDRGASLPPWAKVLYLPPAA